LQGFCRPFPGLFRCVGFRTAAFDGLWFDPVMNFERIDGGNIMRGYHTLGIVAALLIGFAIKLAFFPVPVATAAFSFASGPTLDVSRMHENKQLPQQALRDMSFVYAD